MLVYQLSMIINKLQQNKYIYRGNKTILIHLTPKKIVIHILYNLVLLIFQFNTLLIKKIDNALTLLNNSSFTIKNTKSPQIHPVSHLDLLTSSSKKHSTEYICNNKTKLYPEHCWYQPYDYKALDRQYNNKKIMSQNPSRSQSYNS